MPWRKPSGSDSVDLPTGTVCLTKRPWSKVISACRMFPVFFPRFVGWRMATGLQVKTAARRLVVSIGLILLAAPGACSLRDVVALDDVGSQADAVGADPGPSLPAVDPSSYPSLTPDAMGQLKFILGLAARPLDDFTDLEANGQLDLTSYRYSIAFSGYFLSVVQYHQLPAWSEAIGPAIDRLIHKILLKPVWEYWAETSKGISTLEPNLDMPYPERHDPVGEKNIMYSGHVAHLMNLYAALYRDFSWDTPGSIVYEWAPDERYTYDNKAIIDVMHRQMADNPYHGICCEPNAVFPECNQHPILAFKLYDATHGTDRFAVSEQFYDFFVSKELTDSKTGETAMLYLVKQDSTLSQANPRYGNSNDELIRQLIDEGVITFESASANGWTGTFMHAWKPGFVESRWPLWKARHYTPTADGAAILKDETWEPRVRYGFFAMLAGELGDLDARDRLLAYADRTFPRVQDAGGLHYRCPPVSTSPCTNLTDKLIAFARVNPPGGWRAVHERPFDDAHFTQPRLTGVDFPAILVRRALFDRSRRALVASFEPGTRTSGTTIVRIEGLDPSSSWQVFIDKILVSTVSSSDRAEVTVGMDGPHDLVVQAL